MLGNYVVITKPGSFIAPHLYPFNCKDFNDIESAKKYLDEIVEHGVPLQNVGIYEKYRRKSHEEKSAGYLP